MGGWRAWRGRWGFGRGLGAGGDWRLDGVGGLQGSGGLEGGWWGAEGGGALEVEVGV